MTTFTEAEFEEAALAWLGRLGWRVAHGPEMASATLNAERGTDLPPIVVPVVK